MVYGRMEIKEQGYQDVLAEVRTQLGGYWKYDNESVSSTKRGEFLG
jgi:hypothetical protein